MNEDAVAHLREVLSRYVPSPSLERLTQYIIQKGVHLRITSPRSSKFGDYRWPRRGQNYHAISVNGNLNPYFFLQVLLHEFAHLDTYLLFGNKVKPHGYEWQKNYHDQLSQYADCFPEEAQPLLARYLSRLPLQTTIGHQFDDLLKRYGTPQAKEPALTLNDLAPNTLFRIVEKPQKLFRSMEKQRTRWVCKEVSTGLLFSVKGTVEVKPE